MSTAEFSRQMIANGMKEMLKTTPLEGISIGDLAKHCQVSRSTVYYHFKDKYDIISWIFHTEIRPIVDPACQVGSWTDNLMAMCLYFQRNREFYTRVLQDSGQNSFYECLTDFCRDLILHMFRESGGYDLLGGDQIGIISSIYSYGIVGYIRQWSAGGMKEDPAAFVETLRDLISGAIFDRMLALSREKGKTSAPLET